MKIVLTRPKYKTHIITPPLGMGVLSSYLKQKGHDVKIIDGLNLNYSNKKIANKCSDSDLVGVYCLSAFFNETIDLIKELKSKKLKTMVGGMQATFLPEYTLKKTKADYVIVGEAEGKVN